MRFRAHWRRARQFMCVEGRQSFQLTVRFGERACLHASRAFWMLPLGASLRWPGASSASCPLGCSLRELWCHCLSRIAMCVPTSSISLAEVGPSFHCLVPCWVLPQGCSVGKVYRYWCRWLCLRDTRAQSCPIFACSTLCFMIRFFFPWRYIMCLLKTFSNVAV